jgi:hypothetical protein
MAEAKEVRINSRLSFMEDESTVLYTELPLKSAWVKLKILLIKKIV